MAYFYIDNILQNYTLTSLQQRTWKCGQESRLIRWWSCWHTCCQPVVQCSAIVRSRPLLLPSYNNAFRHIWLSSMMGFEFFMHETKKIKASTTSPVLQTWGCSIYRLCYKVVSALFKILECGPIPNVMAAQPNVGGVLCESSVIPLIAPRHKVWLTAAAVPCRNGANVGERKTSTQSEFCRGQNSVTGNQPPKMYI